MTVLQCVYTWLILQIFGILARLVPSETQFRSQNAEGAQAWATRSRCRLTAPPSRLKEPWGGSSEIRRIVYSQRTTRVEALALVVVVVVVAVVVVETSCDTNVSTGSSRAMNRHSSSRSHVVFWGAFLPCRELATPPNPGPMKEPYPRRTQIRVCAVEA